MFNFSFTFGHRLFMKLLRGDNLKKKILRTIKNLPAMPQIVLKAQEIADVDADLKDFERTLEADQALVSMVLRVANSAYYGQCSKVSSIRRAAVVLGFKTLGEIVILASSSKLLDKPLRGYGFVPEELWRHSLAVAFGSKIIANRKKYELANDAYIAGLLHDAGKLILDSFVLERKAIFNRHTEADGRWLHEVEKSVFGFDHAEIAGIVCRKWNFPELIYNAIRFHHNPLDIENNELAFIIYTANKIAKWCVEDTEAVILEIDDTMKKMLGFQDDEMELIMDEMTATIDQITDSTWEMMIKHYN